jgi:hypothetical protein
MVTATSYYTFPIYYIMINNWQKVWKRKNELVGRVKWQKVGKRKKNKIKVKMSI